MTREEFAELAISHLEELTAYARRLARSASDADDLLQETYARAFRHWRTLRQPQACRAWLFRVARNAYTDSLRGAATRPELTLVGGLSDTSRVAPVVPAESVERLDARQLEWALATLAHEQREAVLLCDLWGFSYQEIAEIMDCPLGTVQSRVARGRTSVIAALAAEGHTRAGGRRER